MTLRNEEKVAQILLVEDNSADVTMVRRFLSKSKVKNELEVVNDGDEALKHLRSGKPCHIMLLDLNLPRVSGWKVLEELKEQEAWRSIPVIVFTTSNSQEDINRAYDLHANTYIVKPNSMDKFSMLIDAIERYWFGVARLPDPITGGGELNE